MAITKSNSWTLTAALAGFLFGFDTVVISGANEPIKELWHTMEIHPLFHGLFIMSMALWGTVIGAVFGSIPTDRIGRKKTMFWIGVLYTVSALGCAIAWDPYSFSFFRFVGGLGVGASTVTVPVYLAEISSASQRGKIGARYQFMIVFGIFIAFFSNYLLDGVGGDNDWRWMLGIEAIPAIVYSIMVLQVPKSPRWLVLYANKTDEAQQVLKELGVEDTAAAVKEIQLSAVSQGPTSVWQKKFRKVVGLAFLLSFFNQASGINFVLYYAPEILEKAGLSGRESLGSSISIGFVNLIFTMLGVYLIDRAGRKTLLIWGSVGYIISLFMVAYAFYNGSSPVFLLTFICLFIASHAVGQGAIIWVFISEIFPTSVRAGGMSWGSSVHWVFAAMITLITPYFLDSNYGVFKDNPWPIFVFFGSFMVLQLLFALFLLPETKGRSLEQIERELIG